METWIIADHAAIVTFFHPKPKMTLRLAALPAVDLESRGRHDVLDALAKATVNCKNPYAKDKRSFELIAMLNPKTLAGRLPSFNRMLRILEENL